MKSKNIKSAKELNDFDGSNLLQEILWKCLRCRLDYLFFELKFILCSLNNDRYK